MLDRDSGTEIKNMRWVHEAKNDFVKNLNTKGMNDLLKRITNGEDIEVDEITKELNSVLMDSSRASFGQNKAGRLGPKKGHVEGYNNIWQNITRLKEHTICRKYPRTMRI